MRKRKTRKATQSQTPKSSITFFCDESKQGHRKIEGKMVGADGANNYTKKTENRSKLFVSRFRSIVRVVCAAKSSNQLQATLSKCPGFVLSQCTSAVSSCLSRDRLSRFLVLFVFNCSVLLNWGTGPGRGRAACTCSKFARTRSRRGSRGRDVRPRHSCSTFGLGCSHLDFCQRGHEDG